MEYIEVSISGISGEYTDILIAELSESGFESFSEDDGGGLNAYIPSSSFDIMSAANFLEERSSLLGFSYHVSRIPQQNWNAVWESCYLPVLISGRCMIRAPFHEPDPSAEFDLVIEPKMSFGTAHHETTRLMIETILDTDLRGMKVLDMGCGTAVLAVLAAKMGAKQVVAVDNDEWAFENALENTARNNEEGICVIRGDAATVPAGDYNIILANINRNVLLDDMITYYSLLREGGLMILSGFYSEDNGIIIEKAGSLGFRHTGLRELNNWVVATFTK
jgi:ribosomal protein L11 methyltransferase